MNRRHLTHIAVLALAGVLVRGAIFGDVAVNGDSGLYIYDAKQILWGRQMFVDFPSRSPIFEYALAGLVSLPMPNIIAARWAMLTISVAVGVAGYAFARQLHSHRAGLITAALILLQPFPAVWGLWIKTENASALLALIAVTIGVTVLHRERIPHAASLAVGALFAASFLVRRVTLVHMGAFALFVLWYRQRRVGEPIFRTLTPGVVAAVGACTTAAAVFLPLARFDPGLAWQMVEHHTIALFSTDGFGSLGYVPLEASGPTLPDANPWYIRVWCQRCGANTVGIWLRGMFGAIPLFALLLVLVRTWWDDIAYDSTRIMLPALFFLLGGWGLVSVVSNNGVGMKAAGTVALLLAVAVAWTLPTPPMDRLRTPWLALPVLIAGLLVFGYLYRNRILYQTYFQDIYPYAATVAGITADELWRHYAAVRPTLDWPDRAAANLFIAVLLIGGTIVGVGMAHPYNPGGIDDPDTHWFEVRDVIEYGDDIETRTAPDERIFTAQPLYMVEADRELANHLSRKYYLFQGWNHSEQTEITEQRLAATLRSGEVAVAVLDTNAQTVLGSGAINQTLREHYCPRDVPLYEQTGGTLWVWAPEDAPRCLE